MILKNLYYSVIMLCNLMEDNAIDLDEGDLKKLRNRVEFYLSESPSNRIKEIVKKFGISSEYVARLSYDGLESVTYDLVEDINASGYSHEFLEYMSEEDSPGWHFYSEMLGQYIEESSPGTYPVESSKIEDKVDSKTLDESIEEPTIALAIYEKILRIIHDTGKGIENLASSYKNHDEEKLRDYLQVTLGTHFTGSFGGETFNKVGKTDILLRHDSYNLFVAECKIWTGESEYLKAINQLMRYLTLRDSKTALIIFVQNKKISNIFEKILTQTPKHENYIQFVKKRYDSWFDYIFHVNGDKSRLVRLAIIIIHIPQ